jgi:probable F420-dependent oxidoreductase
MTLLTDRSISPARLGAEVEARGFSSLYVAEHSHIPVSGRDQWPGGAELPDEYRRLIDPFLALAAAATSTQSIRLGTGVCLVAQRDPIILAKEIATLDLISNGRVAVGVGIGWNTEEAENHGVNPTQRRAIVREKILAMKSLWMDDVAEFHGEFVNVTQSWAWPKPVQVPHPPIILGGGGGPVTWRHVIEYCDGWMPIVGTTDIAAKARDLRAAAEAAGRDPSTLQIKAYGGRGDQQSLAQYAEQGVQEVLLSTPSVGDRTYQILDRLAAASNSWSET